MRSHRCGPVLVALISCILRPARADILPNLGAGDLMRKSDIVALVRIAAFERDRTAAQRQGPAGWGNEELKPGGNYTFDVLHMLKGDVPSRIRIHLDALRAQFTNHTRPPADSGNCVVLFLVREPGGALTPTVPPVAFVPVSPQCALMKHAGDAGGLLTGILLRSAESAPWRRCCLYMLRLEKDPRLIPAMRRYAADPDIHVRDLALLVRATNQDVSAIPAILKLEYLVEKQIGSCAECIDGLDGYTDKRAGAAVAPLAIAPSRWVRISASQAVRRLANRGAIPYLLLALHDPEVSNAYGAYEALHRVIGTLGPAGDWPYFEANREKECAKLFAWWEDELAGKHPGARRI